MDRDERAKHEPDSQSESGSVSSHYIYRLAFLPFLIGVILILDFLEIGLFPDHDDDGYGRLLVASPLMLFGAWATWRVEKKRLGDAPVLAVVRHLTQLTLLCLLGAVIAELLT